MLDGLGIDTGIDLHKLFRAGQFICRELGREPASRVAGARRQARFVSAVSPADDVASPCINVCRMSQETALCEGCLRTLDEIAAWSR